MSLMLKRSAKATLLSLVSSRDSTEPDLLSETALRMMRIGLEPGSSIGYEGGTKSACCVSVDFDVTKAGREVPNHEGTRALLTLSEKYGIPLTWAICGRTAEEDPASYESILRSSVPQEIGVHTYSHIYADEQSEEEYRSDIQRCISVLGLTVPPTTFVFPKNREGHFGLLKRMGFTSYRGSRRVIGAPVENSGLCNIRPVYYVDQKSLKAAGLIRRFVDACISRSGVFHLWTHPWSLVIDGNVDKMASGVIEPVFAYLETKRAEGVLSVSTMRGITSYFNRRAEAGQRTA